MVCLPRQVNDTIERNDAKYQIIGSPMGRHLKQTNTYIAFNK